MASPSNGYYQPPRLLNGSKRAMKALFGTKIGMTQIIGEDGTTIPVTLIQAGPMTVTQVKSVETDGYNAVQVAYGTGKNLSKAVAGHVKPAGVTPKKIGEIRVDELGGIKVGDTWNVSATLLMRQASARVKVGLALSSGTTSNATAKPTAARVIHARSVRSVACTRKKYSKASAWPDTWAPNRLLSRT